MPWKEAQDLMGVIENHLFELLSPADPAPIALEHRLGRLIAARLGRDSLALEDLAASLGLTPRTLRRHLSQQGLHFGAVLEQERRRRAAQLLEGGQIRIEELARLLGYASPAAFSRAYRKWTGITPSMALQQARGHQQMPHPRDHADEA